MPDILVRTTRAEPGEASLEVSIPPENVRPAEEPATKVYQQRARLPGFRQGKAPAAVVRKKFADDIRQETLRELVQESWRVAQKQEELKPIADPHIHNLKWEDGAPVTFEFHVELKPELKLERVGNFRLTRKVAAVTAAQVDAQLNTMREQRAPWTPVAGEKPKPKDLVDVMIATRENGEIKDPQHYQFVLGEGRAIPDVEERIMNLLPGESVDATVRFPDDFAEEAKRGQTRDIQLTLREVKRQELATLDDAFARETGDFESLDALRTAVATDLGKEAERDADAKVRSEPVQQIVQAHNAVAMSRGASPRRRCSPISCRSPPWSKRDEERKPHLSPVHHRALEPWRAHLRHLQPPADGPHRVPRHVHHRRCRQHHHRPAAVSRCRQPGTRYLPVREFPRWARFLRHGDLRHDA